MVLRKAQEEMKRWADRGQREVEEWDKVMLSTKNLIFNKRLVKVLMEILVELYMIEKVVLKNIVKLKLLATMRIYQVVNVSRVVRYRELIKE